MTHTSYGRHGHPGPRSHYARHSGYGHRLHGGRRARRGDIRAAILALLADRPMHGYEMIKELEERTGGVWSPSAGSIYPTLQLLEDEGLIRGTEQAGKRRFELTAEGTTKQNEARRARLAWESVAAGAPAEGLKLKRPLKELNGRRCAGDGQWHGGQRGRVLSCSTRRGGRSTGSSPTETAPLELGRAWAAVEIKHGGPFCLPRGAPADDPPARPSSSSTASRRAR